MKDYIESGILEMYVLGLTTDEENVEIVKLSVQFSAVKNEIDLIKNTLNKYSNMHNLQPDDAVKRSLMNTVFN